MTPLWNEFIKLEKKPLNKAEVLTGGNNMFNKCLLLVASFSLLLGSITLAQFIDEESDVVSVEQAKKLSDNSWVVLEGYIIKRLNEDQYTFKDSTGTIKIIVRNSSWQGIEVSPKTKVRITGQVDKLFIFLPKRTIKVNKVELTRK